jgi:uncharacterized tellurite resistance protein B-like protein
MSLWKLLGLSSEPADDGRRSDTESVRRIAESLNRLDGDRARYVAMFAYILSRVAHVDMEVSEDETRAMERIIREHGHLPDDQAVMVVQLARTQSLVFAGTDDFIVTREFDRLASHEQKLALLDCLFAVSASDRTILTVEDNEIRRIARELRIEHADFVNVRAAYRDHLAVLQAPSRTPSDG